MDEVPSKTYQAYNNLPPRGLDHKTSTGSNVEVNYKMIDQKAAPGHSDSIEIDAPRLCNSKENKDNNACLRQQQLSLKQNGWFAFNRSPKRKKCSGDLTRTDNHTDEYDERGLKISKFNLRGKVRLHKCKKCEFVTDVKALFWEHSKAHIRPEKLLTCPKCLFVTEYKHHLNYHILTHEGFKPFQCSKCNYTCVNKAMLTSHLKSHSNVYQYRCADCKYVTKYCHPLKLHLLKYDHKPAMILPAEEQAMQNGEEISHRMETEAEVSDFSKLVGEVHKSRSKDDEELTTMFSIVEVIYETDADAGTPPSDKGLENREGDPNNNITNKGVLV